MGVLCVRFAYKEVFEIRRLDSLGIGHMDDNLIHILSTVCLRWELNPHFAVRTYVIESIADHDDFRNYRCVLRIQFDC